MDEQMLQPLDDEERRIMEALDPASAESVSNVEDEKQKALVAAGNTLKKTERINLRLTKRDLVGIKAAAREEEIPYQTLIAHLVRKYLEERMKERLGERAS
jgi:predicted DNA binding CopG/RHH family protein